VSDTEKQPAPPAQNAEPARAPEARAPAGKPALSQTRRQANRRKFIRSALLAGGVIGFALLGYVPVVGARRNRLRPPGALDEKDFLASCIKCGQCVQVCPVQAIKLADLADGFGVGVPHIDARDQACDFSCDAVQCVLACPTGALVYKKPAFMPVREGARLAKPPILRAKEKDPEPTLEMRERMGLARLVRPEACLAVQGRGFKGQARGADFRGLLRYMDVDRWKPVAVRDHPYDIDLCDLCVRECPVQGAISLEPADAGAGSSRMTPVVNEACVGCGVCEMVCPAEPTAIAIEERAVW
jgi:ferredoxin-type protein NapG